MAHYNTVTGVIIMLITLSLCCTSIHGKNYKYSSSCYDSSVKTLTMKCGQNEMLRIARAFYGYSPAGRCSFSPGDCTFDEHHNYACVGRQNCAINMPGGLGRPVPKCKHPNPQSNYFQVEYECVPVEQTINICQVSEATAQSGYISSPSYPLNYNKPHQCQISIDLRTKQKVRLVIVDMNLHENDSGKGCTDYLYIRNELRSVTVCGQRGSEELFDSSGKIDIQFAAEAGGDNKGFWLYYEAYPQIDETTTTTTTVKTTTLKNLIEKLTEKTSVENPIKETEVKIEHEESQGSSTLTQRQQTETSQTTDEVPFAAIVGGVIGSLCFILTVLLILLVLQRLKEKRDLEKKKHLPFLDVRNQAFQSNSELCPQDSNYC
ncbi:uncharacterized protein LOC135467237 isoform X2 [Liolophura sinensis]